MALTQSHEVNGQHHIYATCSFMVIDPCAKYGMPMSNKKRVMGQTRKHVKNPVNWTLRSKGNIILGSCMYVTHCLVVIHPWAKYSKPTSKQNKVKGRTQICRQTDRQSDSYIPPNFVYGGYYKYLFK